MYYVDTEAKKLLKQKTPVYQPKKEFQPDINKYVKAQTKKVKY